MNIAALRSSWEDTLHPWEHQEEARQSHGCNVMTCCRTKRVLVMPWCCSSKNVALAGTRSRDRCQERLSTHMSCTKMNVIEHQRDVLASKWMDPRDNNMRSFKWIRNDSKTFESYKLDSNYDCNLSLSRSLDFDCNCSMSWTRIAYP